MDANSGRAVGEGYALSPSYFVHLSALRKHVGREPYKPTLTLEVQAELLTALFWLPLMVISLRTPVTSLVTVSDASLKGGAVSRWMGFTPLCRGEGSRVAQSAPWTA